MKQLTTKDDSTAIWRSTKTKYMFVAHKLSLKIKMEQLKYYVHICL